MTQLNDVPILSMNLQFFTPFLFTSFLKPNWRELLILNYWLNIGIPIIGTNLEGFFYGLRFKGVDALDFKFEASKCNIVIG